MGEKGWYSAESGGNHGSIPHEIGHIINYSGAINTGDEGYLCESLTQTHLFCLPLE